MITEGLRARNYVLSPSSLEHVQACPASRVYTAKRPPKSHANWFGIAIHLFLEQAMKTNRAAALTYIKRKFPRQHAFCERIDFNSIPKGDPEVQFLIDTHHRTAYRGEWQEADPDQHIIARADLVLDFENGTHKIFDNRVLHCMHWIVDYKSGKTAPYELPTTTQMETLAVARWLELGSCAGPIGVAIAAILSDGQISWTTHVILPQYLRQGVRRLREVHLRVLETRAERREEDIEPEFKAGGWCRKCSAYDICETRKADTVLHHVQDEKYRPENPI